MRVALATCSAMPEGFPPDRGLADALRERDVDIAWEVWDHPGVPWDAYDLVVVRSTFDYPARRDEFLAWAEMLGKRVLNPPAVLRWNSDKIYLAHLAAAGLPVVPTRFVAPGDPLPKLDGEVVVKPAVSVGARNTGRFAPSAHDGARRLLVDITETGQTALVQPYLRDVERRGEAALVFCAGELSHVLRKGIVLRPDEVAPISDDAIGAALVMYEEDLVAAGEASEGEIAIAQSIMAHVSDRFGVPPLYARVDLLAGQDGAPTLLELELVEPSLYLDRAPGAAERLAAAILAPGARREVVDGRE